MPRKRLLRLLVRFMTRACARLGIPATADNLWAQGEALLNDAFERCPVVEKSKKGKK